MRSHIRQIFLLLGAAPDGEIETEAVANGNTFEKRPRELEIEVLSSDKKAAISVGGTQVLKTKHLKPAFVFLSERKLSMFQ